jgi:hypothetical protein
MTIVTAAEDVLTFDWDAFDFEYFRGEGLTFPIDAKILLAKRSPPHVYLSAIDLLNHYLPSLMDPENIDLEYVESYTKNEQIHVISEEDLVIVLGYLDEGERVFVFTFHPNEDEQVPSCLH